MALLSFANAILLLITNSPLTFNFDDFFVWLFFCDLLLRIVAVGPENFFYNRWNKVDTSLTLVGVGFFFVIDTTGADSLIRMSKIFRVATVVRVASHSSWKGMDWYIFQRIKNIFEVMMEILPIILKFMPLMVFFFYIFAIIGMEVFYNSYDTLGSPLYNSYQQFQSFRTFIQSQYLLVQILAKSAWSHVAYDHCFRNPDYFTPVMIFFTGTQITLVYIVSTIIKGVFWEIYFTVDSIFVEREKQIAREQE